MSNLFEGCPKHVQAQKVCEAIRKYREYKTDVEKCHPDGFLGQRQDVFGHLALLKMKKNEEYLKWLEMEVNPYGQ